jgi:periplasmic protein CpxP/Spy
MANSQMGNSPQAQKLAMMTKQLNLSPEQKMKLMPILEEEAPKVQAIKSNSSLTGMQKMEQLRAIHEQTNPQVQAILSPQQYQQFQQIRQQEIEQAIQKKR